MTTALLFEKQLTEFDETSFKPLLESEVYNTIQLQVEEGQTDFSIEEYAELVGFRFLESYNRDRDETKRYYKPFKEWTDENGNLKEFPSLSQISEATISYWSYRSSNALHPVLIARYSGLVYDLSLEITGKKPNYKIAETYVEAILEIVKRDLYKVATYAIGKIRRALSVAILINNKNLIEKSKNEILLLEDKIAVNDKPGLWGFSYDLLIAGKKRLVSEEEETIIINSLIKRLNETINIELWPAECATRRLAEYYNTKNEKEKIKSVINIFEDGTNEKIVSMPAFQQQHNLETLYSLYNNSSVIF